MTIERATQMWIVMAIALVSSTASAQDARAQDRVVTVSAARKTFRFGEHVPLQIRHLNRSATVWRLQQPNRIAQCEFHFLPIDKKPPIREEGDTVYFGPYYSETVRNGIRMYGEPKKRIVPNIEIAPGQSFDFSYDIYSLDYFGDMIPGRWKAWFINHPEKCESEPFEFQVVFSNESVEYMLDMASDARYSHMMHCAAVARLREVKGRIRQPGPPFWKWMKNVQLKEMDEINVYNRRINLELEDWWRDNQYSNEVRQAIDAINAAYGLDPAAARRDVELLPSIRRRPPPPAMPED